MINNKEKKMIQRYCIYPKIAVVALIFSFVQCALIVPLEMIDDLNDSKLERASNLAELESLLNK